MKPPQRVHPHFTCPIFPVPQPEKAGRMKRNCWGNTAFRLRALLSSRQHVLMVSVPTRYPESSATFPVIPPSLPANAMCFQLLKNCSYFCPLPQYVVGGVGKESGSFAVWKSTGKRDALISLVLPTN